MSGIGPVEPGEGTRAWDTVEPTPPLLPGTPRERLTSLYARHRRAVLASATAVALVAGGGYLFATRPHEPPPPEAPYPSQAVDIAYLGEEGPPAKAPSRSFSFGVKVTVRSGPTITIVRISQPYATLSLTSVPHPPFRTRPGFGHKIVVTMHVTECANVPSNAGLPFLDVTLRNTRAMEDHSFILGERYAHDLSQALRVACGNGPPSSPKQ
ncbi:Tat pathway signal sequence domain protein [Streptomyces sp. NBC_00878]|uniref:Tat pathway signal sequence domain protein n=1 Tax=Streptomyces sp. NBC_00878 TaxID=2975854 RepID=UPI0022554EC6|nr:Tat pathway signal sequence domain protein [Streptomyces sp. NBC_00878]MCX4909521.1 Tat pathway signal sequence domain protein [Streptomyces sp. NBC_00878]